jgi:hypothetical protein
VDIPFGRIIAIVSALACMVIAYFKGRRIILWGALGYFLSFVAVVILLLRMDLPRKEYPVIDGLRQRYVSRGIRKRFEGLETTKDFLKEIDDEKKDEK